MPARKSMSGILEASPVPAGNFFRGLPTNLIAKDDLVVGNVERW